MKRDMDLIRMLLLREEAGKMPDELSAFDNRTIAYHVALMRDAGLVEGNVVDDENGEPFEAVIFRLTWDGHEFLAATRNSEIWKGVKQHIIKPGVSWTFSILLEWLKDEAKRRIAAGHLPVP